MSNNTARSTIYFEKKLHQLLRLKAAETHKSISELVNEAVRAIFVEDQEDLSSFDMRVEEPTINYEAMLNKLKADGKL